MRVGSAALSDIIERRKVDVSDKIVANSCFLSVGVGFGMDPVIREVDSGSVRLRSLARACVRMSRESP